MAPNTYDEGEDDRQIWNWLTGGGTTDPVATPPSVAIGGSGSGTSNVAVTKIGSTAVDSNSGVKSAGTLRVVLATDQPALTTPMPITQSTNTAGTLTPSADATVAGTSASILASNANRKACFIQNVGTANIRVGTGTVTATTGLQLVPGATLVLESPFCPTAAITAIRETATSSTVAVAEVA